MNANQEKYQVSAECVLSILKNKRTQIETEKHYGPDTEVGAMSHNDALTCAQLVIDELIIEIKEL